MVSLPHILQYISHQQSYRMYLSNYRNDYVFLSNIIRYDYNFPENIMPQLSDKYFDLITTLRTEKKCLNYNYCPNSTFLQDILNKNFFFNQSIYICIAHFFQGNLAITSKDKQIHVRQ